MVTAKKTIAKVAAKAPKVSKRITGESIREHAKKDHSPKWDNAAEMSGAEFGVYYRFAMQFYNFNHSGKDLKPRVIDWMGRNDYTKTEIASYKKTKDWRSSLTTGAIASCLLRGMPEVHPEFNKGRSFVEWLRKDIAAVIAAGKADVEEVVEVKGAKASAPVITIQDRIREQAGQMSEEIDYAIDSFLTDPDAFDPKAFKMVSLLRGKGAKAAQSRYIKGFFQKGLDELLELASGKGDEQLREAYKHLARKNVKKLIEFYQSIMSACDQIAAEAKVLKKPRAAKIKPAEELVKKLKFRATDDKLGVVSVPSAGLIGAQGAVTYNTKTRKVGLYIAKTSAGLGVKGTSITGFTEKSVQKTLRKPAEQLKEFKTHNTQRRVETWMGAIKATDTLMNGRMNADIMILKLFK
jgi:hypothetical protein